MGDNKVQAERMYDIAARYFEQGSLDKARQFIERADKLHSSKQIKDLLSKIIASQNSGSSGSSKSPGGAATSSNRSTGSGKVPGGAASSSANHNGASEDAGTENQPEYTPEQLSEVQRIRKCRDFYEILSVDKTATDDDVKRAYRKLAMKLHPDKNKAPGATEAFRAVSNAFAVLSDADKRRKYDVSGPDSRDHSTMRDGPAPNARGSARRRFTRDGDYFYEYDFSRGFESDMNAEDIFNMFFGGGLFAAAEDQNGEHAAQNRERVYRARTEGSNHLMWLQIAPFIALILLSLLSSVFRSDPPFSLTRTGRFTESRETSSLRVKYFVKSDFDEHFGDRIGVIELEAENEYYNTVRSKCYNEQAYRESVIYRARLYGDNSAFNQARNMAMPNCDELNRISKYF